MLLGICVAAKNAATGPCGIRTGESEGEIVLSNQVCGKDLEYRAIAVNKAGEGSNIVVDVDVHNSEAITDRLHRQAEADRLRTTAHAHQEMWKISR